LAKTAKTRHFGKITAFRAFDENYGFRDFRVSVIIYYPWSQTVTVDSFNESDTVQPGNG